MKYFIGNNLFEYENTKSSNFKEALEYLNKQEVIGIDIETGRKFKKNIYKEDVYRPGLDPHMSKIIMIQIGTIDKTFIIDVRQFDKELIKNFLQPLLENRDILKVGQNLKFEGKFFLHHYGLRILNVWDTMIVEKILYNGSNQSNSLAALMNRYLGIKSQSSVNLFTKSNKIAELSVRNNNFFFGTRSSEEELMAQAELELEQQQYVNKSIRLGFIDLGTKPFTQEQIDYGEEDIVCPLKIYKIQLKGRDGWFPKVGIDVENAFTQVLAEAEVQGIPFDSLKWMEAYEKAFKLYNERKDKLDQYVMSNCPNFCNGINLFSNKPTCAIQWSSSKQVIGLFKSLGICPKERSSSTKRIEYTVGAKTLFRSLPNELKGNFFKSKDVEIEDFNTLILQYLLYKKAEQLCTTFGKDWLKYVHPITGKVHTNYNQYMISSRLSSNSPNLQQIPGSADYRDCFTHDKLINSDFAGQELRVAAEVHGVQKMMDFFILGDETFGDDLHSFNATQMFKVIHNDENYLVPPKDLPTGEKNPNFRKEHTKERNAAKNLIFKLNYGGSSYTVAMDLGITEDEAETYIENYFKGLPGMKESFEVKKKLAVKRGWIQLDKFTDKRYYFPQFKRMQEAYKEVMDLYPEEYRGMKYEEKEEVKQILKDTTNYSDLWKEYWQLRGKLERRSLNLPIQGASATMTKMAGLLLYKYRWDNGLNKVFQVPIYCHDEILAVITDGKAKEYAVVIENLMAESGKYILRKVPMKAEACIGKIWAH